ncbi:MAG TPA: hypothetical protein VMW48_03615 [Vicinamibacterales bacterium]|nr:hypothetical protein [Vicinamibacterales bacterium]
MKIPTLGILVPTFAAAAAAGAQGHLPVIDMHLHALAADSQGPPPVAMCTPMAPFPVWDPARPA